jgi:hypothetical protein
VLLFLLQIAVTHTQAQPTMTTPRTTAQLQSAIEALQHGHTSRSDEARILALLEQAEARQLDELLTVLDLHELFDDIDNHRTGNANRDRLYQLLTVERLDDLSVAARSALVSALQTGRTDSRDEQAIARIFLGTRAGALTELKNRIDAGGDYRDLQQLIYTDIDDAGLRADILRHIRREGEAHPRDAVKAISDIDDTFYANLKDRRYPKGTVYPGVIRYYQELTPGGGSSGGQLVFLTARPKVRPGLIEDHTHDSLRTRGLEQAFTILSGAFSHWVGSERIAAKKYQNFVEYQQLFPEYGFVFTGDSGQGDAIFGARIIADFPERVRAVLIHDVAATPQLQQDDWRARGVVFFDSYVGAALAAFEAGLIGRDGVQRVIGAARRDLAAVRFDDEQQRAARTAEIERDIAAASGIFQE